MRETCTRSERRDCDPRVESEAARRLSQRLSKEVSEQEMPQQGCQRRQLRCKKGVMGQRAVGSSLELERVGRRGPHAMRVAAALSLIPTHLQAELREFSLSRSAPESRSRKKSIRMKSMPDARATPSAYCQIFSICPSVKSQCVFGAPMTAACSPESSSLYSRVVLSRKRCKCLPSEAITTPPK